MALIQLDEILPEEDEISFKVNGKEYKFPIRISFSVGAYLLENIDNVKEVLPVDITDGVVKMVPKLSAKTLPIVSNVIKAMMKDDYPEVDDEWIRKNISVPRMAIIIGRSVIPIIHYFKSLNIADITGGNSGN